MSPLGAPTASQGVRSPLRARWARRGAALGLVGSASLSALTVGCVSPKDIQGVQTQISDVQRQMLQIQRESPSKEDVGALSATVAKQMESLVKTQADLQVKLEELSGTIEALQAKLEDTNYRLSQLSQQIASTNQKLDTFRPAPQADPSIPGGTTPSGTVSSDPKELYDAAYNDYLKGSYDLASLQFQEYLRSFPDTDLSDNAIYWIGECLYRQRKFRPAIDQFDAVLTQFPKSEKAAGASLKKGFALLELGERTAGIAQLKKVVKEFSASDEANLARQRLKELGA